MSDSDTSGFGKFVPGFDFLQNLAKGASTNIPQMPNLANWVAPTLNVEELDKRISELKNVHYWLEQNSRALGATIQALEVQKMTLATLKGMNFNIADMANAFKLKAADSMASGLQRATEKTSSPSSASPSSKASSDAAAPTKTPAKRGKAAGKAAEGAASGVAGLVDPLNLWGSLTTQFQQIAASAMKEASSKTAVDMTRNLAAGVAKEAIKSATAAGKRASSARRPAARKTTNR